MTLEKQAMVMEVMAGGHPMDDQKEDDHEEPGDGRRTSR